MVNIDCFGIRKNQHRMIQGRFYNMRNCRYMVWNEEEVQNQILVGCQGMACMVVSCFCGYSV